MFQFITTIREWIRSRPYMSVVLASWFGITSTAAGFREDWLPYLFAAFAIPLIAMAYSISRMHIAMLTCIAMIVTTTPTVSSEEQPEPAPAGVAVVVVVVGGVCVYLLVRTCQRLFPKTPAPSTNSPPYLLGGGVDTAASWTHTATTSCYLPQSDESWPNVTMELTGTVVAGNEFHLEGARRIIGNESQQDFDHFQADLARHGITLGPVGTKNYGKNGRPAYEQETNIRFTEAIDERTVTVYSESSPSVPMAIQRSFDLVTWQDFGRVSIPIGGRFKLLDTTARQSAFYRIKPVYSLP